MIFWGLIDFTTLGRQTPFLFRAQYSTAPVPYYIFIQEMMRFKPSAPSRSQSHCIASGDSIKSSAMMSSVKGISQLKIAAEKWKVKASNLSPARETSKKVLPV
ncbi:unnamed protein product [Chrysoparadoxa australica]